MSIKELLLGGLILFFGMSYTNAAPVLSPRPSSPLSKRYNTLLGCDEKQAAKIGKALADMASLANLAFSEAKVSNLGYSHYFKDDELDVFKSAMSTIGLNNGPTNPPYQFIVNCNPTGDVLKKCGKKSYAITDVTVPKDSNDFKSMWICPFFWNGPDSTQDLPLGQDAIDEFCKKTNYKQYVTAGHVLLHEITHLDAVSERFPLSKDGDNQHDTLDYSIGSSPIMDARRLKTRIDDGQKDLQAPAYTAESYAGAATELWFQDICKKDFIPPKTGF